MQPQHFGNYILVERLAIGGMAEVFRARRHGAGGFERFLALKRILPRFAGRPEFVEMFIDEANIAAGLDHPNIVQIHDFGNAEGRYYLAMELVEGWDLHRLLRSLAQVGTPCDNRVAARLAIDVLRGLGHAHEHHDAQGRHLGIVHRDVTPGNLVVGHNGVLKVVDFGIAKARRKVSHTQTGVIKGKSRYLPPEAVRGHPLDARSDLYQTAVILYELVTLHPLYEGRNDAEILQSMLQGEYLAPSRWAEVAQPLEEVILRCLQQDPRKRYRTAAEFEKALDEVCDQIGHVTPAQIGEYVRNNVERGFDAGLKLVRESTSMLVALDEQDKEQRRCAMDFGLDDVPAPPAPRASPAAAAAPARAPSPPAAPASPVAPVAAPAPAAARPAASPAAAPGVPGRLVAQVPPAQSGAGASARRPAPVTPPAQAAGPPPPIDWKAVNKAASATVREISPPGSAAYSATLLGQPVPGPAHTTAFSGDGPDTSAGLEIEVAMDSTPALGGAALRYQIKRKLGRGPLGSAYVALQASLERPVVLKLLDVELPAAAAAEALRAEIRTAALLRDPHALVVHDLDRTPEGVHFIVQEYLEGAETLRDRLDRKGPVDVEEGLNIALQTLEVLAEAHALGIVHGHLRPDKIWLLRGASDALFVKVADFGLGKLTPVAAPSTTAGIDPRGYLAPESLAGQKIGPRADLYGVGLLLYEALLGTPPPPPRQTQRGLAAARLRIAPAEPRAALLPLGLRWVIEQSLQHEPSERPATALRLREALLQAVAKGQLLPDE